ncbi:ABC-three component system protein [Mycoplasma capricolum]|uniref:ABC-three component system protein n=1 Tax=Mycoplasma capricolum TaxID=2095 RepID=UPI0022F3B51E|nr:ABC-three component system protein [Mycoplasma capricolum]WBX36475.1 SMEK domain-containing protein [Mycoplasma capricolum subsp. capricolum]
MSESKNSLIERIALRLSTYQTYITNLSKIGKTDENLNAERIYTDVINTIFNLELSNYNSVIFNNPGFDLIDKKNKILIQVSATCSKDKIQNSLSKININEYQNYNFKFLCISNQEIKNVKKLKFQIPNTLLFEPKKDIWDVSFLIQHLYEVNIIKLEKLLTYLNQETLDIINFKTLSSDIATIINILSTKMDNQYEDNNNNKVFNIEEKIVYNNLFSIRNYIYNNASSISKVIKVYEEFEKQGKNISKNVISQISRTYYELLSKYDDPIKIFWKIIWNLENIVKNSSNLDIKNISVENISSSLSVIVVDAFMKCKIYKKPGE